MNALEAFLSDTPPKAYVQGKAPLVCLVLYINLQFDDEKHRVGQINTMFKDCHHDEYIDELLEVLKTDQDAYACYQAAMKAAQDGLIEQFDPDFDTDNKFQNESVVEKFYTISFLTWAEKAGFKIPEYVMLDVKDKIELHARDKMRRDVMRQNFIRINTQELENLMNEPLWTMPDALLYLLGFKNNGQDLNKKIHFLIGKQKAQKLQKYIEDAYKICELMLIGYDDRIILDSDPKSHEKRMNEKFFSCKISPKDLVRWAKKLPLDLPILPLDSPNIMEQLSTGKKSIKTIENKTDSDLLTRAKKLFENTPPPRQRNQQSSYEIEFSDVSGEVVLNGLFILARPTPNGQNYKIIRYLAQNANQFVTVGELKEKALDGKEIDKRLTDFIAQINMNKDLGKLFFDTSKDSIRLNNPVTPERMAAQNIKKVRIKAA